MTSVVFRLQKCERFVPGYPPTGVRMVFEDQVRKGLPRNHADLGWLAMDSSGQSTGAFVNDYFERCLQDQLSRRGIREDLFQVAASNGVLRGNNLASQITCQNFAMVAVCQPTSATISYPRQPAESVMNEESNI